MRDELDKLLCERYPKIFKNRNASIQESCMAWGFACGDGWFDLIDNLCGEIQHHIDVNAEKGTPQFVCSQVKEKFGTLRFYGDGGDRTINNFIWFAESMSGRICETCGKPGKRRGRGYIYTACDEHTQPGDLNESSD